MQHLHSIAVQHQLRTQNFLSFQKKNWKDREELHTPWWVIENVRWLRTNKITDALKTFVYRDVHKRTYGQDFSIDHRENFSIVSRHEKNLGGAAKKRKERRKMYNWRDRWDWQIGTKADQQRETAGQNHSKSSTSCPPDEKWVYHKNNNRTSSEQQGHRSMMKFKLCHGEWLTTTWNNDSTHSLIWAHLEFRIGIARRRSKELRYWLINNRNELL